MNVDFDNIHEHIIPIEDFRLNWRFTNEEYDKLPDLHLNQLKPLDKEAALFLGRYISQTRLHLDVPFKKNLFRNIDKARVLEGNEKEIKKWLYHRGIAFDKPVYLSWDNEVAMIVPWKLLIKYFDSFWYADDLTVIDESLTWALLFFHEEEIYFGTNKNFVPCDTFPSTEFLY